MPDLNKAISNRRKNLKKTSDMKICIEEPKIFSDEILGYSLIFKSKRKHKHLFKTPKPVGSNTNDLLLTIHLNFKE